MNYKGYVGKVEYDDEAGIFYGEVINLRDVITFQGTSAPELRQAFQDSVDDYLEFCAQRGVADLAREEGATLTPETAYPVWSPYDAFEAAETVLQVLEEEGA